MRTHGPKKSAPAQAFSFWELQGIPIVCICVTSIFYAIFARSIEDFQTYALPIGVGLHAVLVLWLVSVRLQIQLKLGWGGGLPLKRVLIFFFGGLLLSLLLGVLYYSLAVAVVDLYSWARQLNPFENRRHSIGMVAVIVFVTGSFFFWARLKFRFVYGFVEAGVGMAFAVYRFSAEPEFRLPSETGFYFAMMTAGVYLVVRGLDNMHQGWKEGRDPFVAAMVRAGSKPIYPKAPRRLRPHRVTNRVGQRRSAYL